MKSRRHFKFMRLTQATALLTAGFLGLAWGAPIPPSKAPKSGAIATKKSAKKKKAQPKAAPEVYSATQEDDGTPHERVLEARSPAPAIAPKTAAAPAPLSAPTPTAEPTLGFDPIPERHVESIAGRLKLVERLIREHGRAYDYRTLTTRELERILAELEHRKAPAAPTPATAPAEPEASPGIFFLPDDAITAPGAFPRDDQDAPAPPPPPTLFGQHS